MTADFNSILNQYLPLEFRDFIENNFYGQIGEKARLKYLKDNPDFHKNMIKHIALYSDHSVVHVRDVALQVIEVIQKANGKLIPFRDEKELDFLKAIGVQLAYLHDIGMYNFSAFGRFMHPEFAAQYVFMDEFESYLKLLWSQNAGQVPAQLLDLFGESFDEAAIQLIYREVLSLSVAHSKSKMPIHIVNSPEKFRKQLIGILSKPLDLLFFEQKKERLLTKKAQNDPKKQKSFQKKIASFDKKIQKYLKKNPAENTAFTNHYEDIEKDAFRWLTLQEDKFKRFIINLLDVIRCVRSADALRQRGTVLRTSAGYEIFVDRKTANAIYALRDKEQDRLYLLEANKSINAGEANLASSELDTSGDLRVSFHLGSFYKQKIINKAAKNAAFTINDIQADTIQSFKRDPHLDKGNFMPPRLPFENIKILIESTNDNPNFTPLVCQYLAKLNPDITQRVQETFSLQGIDIEEVKRYLDGKLLSTYMQQHESFHQKLLQRLHNQGYTFTTGEPLPGEEDIRVITLLEGEQLIKANSPSGFVYAPLGEGLYVNPLGGYEPSKAAPWTLIGNTGVIRSSVRNADVFAEKNIQLVCIPKETYLQHWYQPLSAKSLVKLWKKELASD